MQQPVVARNAQVPVTVPAPMTLEFVSPASATTYLADASSPHAAFVRIGVWDNAFDGTGTFTQPGRLFNDLLEPDNFVGADTNRFYVRLTDPSHSLVAPVSVDVHGTYANGADIDAGNPLITLTEASPGVWTSNALMLISDPIDRAGVDSGLATGDVGVRVFGQSNYRIRQASMFGYVRVLYRPPGSTVATPSPHADRDSAAGRPLHCVVPVFRRSPDDRRKLPIHLFAFRETTQSALTIASPPNGPPDPAAAIWAQLDMLRRVYERLGIWVWTALPSGSWDPARIQRRNPQDPHSDAFMIMDPPNFVSSIVSIQNPDPLSLQYRPGMNDDGLRIGSQVFGEPDTVRAFFVGFDSSTASRMVGFSFPDSPGMLAAAQQSIPLARTIGSAFVGLNTMRPLTLAHEVTHILTRKGRGRGGHYAAAQQVPGTRFQWAHNLMRGATTPVQDHTASLRIWNMTDADGDPQYMNMITSSFMRPW